MIILSHGTRQRAKFAAKTSGSSASQSPCKGPGQGGPAPAWPSPNAAQPQPQPRPYSTPDQAGPSTLGPGPGLQRSRPAAASPAHLPRRFGRLRPARACVSGPGPDRGAARGWRLSALRQGGQGPGPPRRRLGREARAAGLGGRGASSEERGGARFDTAV